MSIGGTFLDDIQVDFLLQATQASHMTKALTAPRLTLSNGGAAAISIGTLQSYIENVSSEAEASDTTTAVGRDYEVAEIITGTLLYVEATVSADRRYVTLRLQPTVSVLNSLTSYPYDPNSPPAGATAVDADFIQLPNVTEQTLSTILSVPDGGTLLLGGQRLSGSVEREMGPPILSKIPVINRLFVNRGKARDESTLLILVKPTIIINREEEGKL